MRHDFDVVIIGAGVIGASIAWWLARMDRLKIAVIERDFSYRHASTALSAASIRVQFSNPVNVAISKFGAAFIRDFATFFEGDAGSRDLSFRENGYLFLATTDGQAEIMRQNNAVQREMGAEVTLMGPDELAARYPFLNAQGVVLASLGRRDEGWFDNMGLLSGFRELGKSLGVSYLEGEVAELHKQGQRVTDAILVNGDSVGGQVFVNAAGTRARAIARMAGLDLPIEARKRTTFVFQTPVAPTHDAPLIVAPGVYVRPEGAYWMGAVHPQPDPAVELTDFDPRYNEFDDFLWPRLAALGPVFEAMRMKRAWAGHYAYNLLDQNAIVGKHPGLANLYLANGFSGHGLQQAPAIGRGLAELILTGGYRSLDLTELGVERILENRPFPERNIV